MSRPANVRSHLAIGEVLSLLQEEFPDITISKIRFLESQGLLDPERTPSGYRKFYDADIKRLRWILHQQKEHYLPLKVIKERLDQVSAAGRDVLPSDGDADEGLFGGIGDDTGQQSLLMGGDSGAAVTSSARSPARLGASPVGEDALAMHQPNGQMGKGVVPKQRGPETTGQPTEATGASDTLSLDELARASGLSTRDIRHLERFGLIEQREGPDAQVPSGVYDSDALMVAQIAAQFMQHGIEARHMRTYRVVVDREAALFEQVILPVLKQRNPEARKRAARTVAELIQLGDAMRGVLLRRELRDHLSSGG